MGGGEGSSQILTTAYKGKEGFKVAYVRKEIIFLKHKISKLVFFCTTEAITLLFTTKSLNCPKAISRFRDI